MKKVLCWCLMLAMVITMAACGSKGAPEKAGTAETGSGYRIAMVSEVSISDGGWGTACYNAMAGAAEEMKWETAYTDCVLPADFVNAITSYCQIGFDLIFLPGNQYSDATIQVAKDFPDVGFAVLNGTEDIPTANITCMLPQVKQIGWLAGTLAGLMTETKKLGFIGGMETDTTLGKLQGYQEGAKKVDPAIEVTVAYAGSYSDTAKGLEFGNSMISTGVDVFFGDASPVESGARQAADQANGTGPIKIYDIAQPADMLGQNPCVISSVVTDNGGMLRIAMESIMDGSFGNKVIYGSLENGCLSIGKLNEELISKEIQAQYMEYVEQMKEGTFEP